MISLKCGIKKDTNELKKKKHRKRHTDLEIEFMVTGGRVWTREIDWEFGIDMYTPLYLK